MPATDDQTGGASARTTQRSGARGGLRLSAWLLPAVIFVCAAAAAGVAASFSVTLVEEASERAVRERLQTAGLDWAEVDAQGLNVFLIGQAPDEAGRFQALASASMAVDAARVVDQMDVRPSVSLAPPRFSIEILRNDGGVQLIGLVPQATDRKAVMSRVATLAGDGLVSDLMESARHAAPETWPAALDFALDALALLPRAKISVSADLVEVTATADSARERSRVLSELNRTRPEGVRIALDIGAPRPVITPFTLRFSKDAAAAGGAARFDACSADSEESRVAIVTAARDAGLEGLGTCAVGLGAPTTRWAEAARLGIAAVDRLGGGVVTMSDAEITLVALQGTEQSRFDEVVGALETALPPVFDLDATLPETPEQDGAAGPPEFVATRSPEGQVVLRGRLESEIARMTADSFAKAAFGSARVQMSARVVDGLPADWQVRVLAGLEALAMLEHGSLRVLPDDVSLRGVTGNPDARDEMARLLLAKLGQDARFATEVTYEERLDPALALPTPQECLDRALAAKGDRKINFEPGSADLDAEGRNIMDDIAAVLRDCEVAIPLEIQGHTDSQGSEGGNLRLSQQRADTVLAELRNRRVLTEFFDAVGYGEAEPVADNGTEAGREANRRIEFALIVPVEETPEAAAEASGSAEEAGEEALALESETGAEEPQSE